MLTCGLASAALCIGFHGEFTHGTSAYSIGVPVDHPVTTAGYLTLGCFVMASLSVALAGWTMIRANREPRRGKKH